MLPGPPVLRIVSDACGSLLPHGVTGRSYRRPRSPSSSGCRCHGCAALGHGTVCFVSLVLGALILSLRLFFVKNFAVILVEG